MCPSLKQLFLSVELHLRRNALLLCSPRAVDAVPTRFPWTLKKLQDFLGIPNTFLQSDSTGKHQKTTWPSDTQDHLA